MNTRRVLFAFLLLLAAHGGICAGEIEIPNRIDKAKPGEWVTYALGRDMYRKFIVIGFVEEADGRHVVLKSQTLMKKAVMQEDEDAYPVSDSNILLKDFPAAELTLSNETIEVKGEKYDATAVSGTKDGVRFTVYASDRIPVFGLLRVDLFGEAVFTVHEYGFGGE